MHLDPSMAKKTSTHRKGRRKINIEFISDKSRRLITFSKRKAGIMKKAYELATLTGTQVLLLVASETGHVYTFATPKLQPLITKPEGKSFIQSCLNTPDEDAPQEFETMRPKVELDYSEGEFLGPPSSYLGPPGGQPYGGGGYNGYPPYPPNADPPRPAYGSPQHYPNGSREYEYTDYPPDYRAEYHSEFQAGGDYPRQGGHNPYAGGRSQPYPPPPGHDYGHPHQPPPHHSGYSDYPRDYPHPQPDYRGYGHPYPDSKYHDYRGPEFGDPGPGFEPGHGPDMGSPRPSVEGQFSHPDGQ